MITKRPWSDPRDISILEVPTKNASPYLVLLNELVLRLERTPKNRALALDFDTEENLRFAFHSLTRLAPSKLGKGHIAFVRGQRLDGTPALFVYHGPNWKQNGVNRREKEASDE